MHRFRLLLYLLVGIWTAKYICHIIIYLLSLWSVAAPPASSIWVFPTLSDLPDVWGRSSRPLQSSQGIWVAFSPDNSQSQVHPSFRPLGSLCVTQCCTTASLTPHPSAPDYILAGAEPKHAWVYLCAWNLSSACTPAQLALAHVAPHQDSSVSLRTLIPV